MELALATAPAQVIAGDTVRLAATVTNQADEAVELAFGADCVVEFFVRAEDHRIVEPGGEWPCRRGAPRTLRLAPDESVRYEHAWIAGASPGGQPGPGTYTAYAILDEHHLMRAGRREFKSGHRSNEVEIRVAPR